MSQATSSTLSVRITCDRTGYLSESDAERICELIRQRITSDAKKSDSYSDTARPTFSSEQLYADRAIKLWCANDQSLTWLKKAVSRISISNKELVVKSQSEIQKRVNCIFEIPIKQMVFYRTLDELKQILCYQNPGIDIIKRFELSLQSDADSKFYKVMMEIPENLIPSLMKTERRLSIGLTVVYIKFEGPDGKFNSDVPKGWDPVTETIL